MNEEDLFEIVDGVLVKCCSLEEEDIVIPSGVTKIGEDAFKTCEKLKSVTIPEGVKEIGTGAFNPSFLGIDDYLLEKVVLPASLEVIDNCAFAGCKNLKEINLHSGIKRIGKCAFMGCDSLVDKDGFLIINNVLMYCTIQKGTIRIPEGVTAIDDGAFVIYEREEPISIIVPGTVDTIENLHAPISSMKILPGVRRIGKSAFYSNMELESIEIPDTVTEIGERAFCDCVALKSIKLPSSLKRIEEEAFSGSGLTSIEIPEGVEYIGLRSFVDCPNLDIVTINANRVSFYSPFLPDRIKRLTSKGRLDEFTICDSIIDELVVDDLDLLDEASINPYCKRLAVRTFAKYPEDLDSPRAKSHMAFMRDNASSLIELAVESPFLLEFMLEHKFVGKSDIPKILKSLKPEDVELRVKVMDYAVNVLSEDDDNDLKGLLGIE